MVLFSVFTLEVMPGSGVCALFTLPDCAPRPERGSCAAVLELPPVDGGPNCAMAGIAQKPKIAVRRIRCIFHLTQLFPEAADAQPDQHDCEYDQDQEVRPKLRKPAV